MPRLSKKQYAKAYYLKNRAHLLAKSNRYTKKPRTPAQIKARRIYNRNRHLRVSGRGPELIEVPPDESDDDSDSDEGAPTYIGPGNAGYQAALRTLNIP